MLANPKENLYHFSAQCSRTPPLLCQHSLRSIMMGRLSRCLYLDDTSSFILTHFSWSNIIPHMHQLWTSCWWEHSANRLFSFANPKIKPKQSSNALAMIHSTFVLLLFRAIFQATPSLGPTGMNAFRKPSRHPSANKPVGSSISQTSGPAATPPQSHLNGPIDSHNGNLNPLLISWMDNRLAVWLKQCGLWHSNPERHVSSYCTTSKLRTSLLYPIKMAAHNVKYAHLLIGCVLRPFAMI